MHDLEMIIALNKRAAEKRPKLSVIREALEDVLACTDCEDCRFSCQNALKALDKLQ